MNIALAMRVGFTFLKASQYVSQRPSAEEEDTLIFSAPSYIGAIIISYIGEGF